MQGDGPGRPSRGPLLPSIELEVLVTQPAPLPAHFVVPDSAHHRGRRVPGAGLNRGVEGCELGLQPGSTEINLVTDALRSARAGVGMLEPGSAVTPVPGGVAQPRDAFVPVAGFVLGDRAPAGCHVAEALGSVLTLGGGCRAIVGHARR